MAVPWGTIGSLAGNVLGGIFGRRGAREANRIRIQEAQKNRDFQQYNSDTAVRRRVTDLKAAGINPILAAGSQASSPGGATASGIENAMVEPANSAKRVSADVAQIRNILGDTKLKKATETLANTNTIRARHESATAYEVARQARLDTELREVTKSLDAKIYSGRAGELLRRAQLLQSPISSAVGVGRLFK